MAIEKDTVIVLPTGTSTDPQELKAAHCDLNGTERVHFCTLKKAVSALMPGCNLCPRQFKPAGWGFPVDYLCGFVSFTSMLGNKLPKFIEKV